MFQRGSWIVNIELLSPAFMYQGMFIEMCHMGSLNRQRLVCEWTYVGRCVSIYVLFYTCMHAFVRMYAYIYICVYIYIHIYRYIYAHTQKHLLLRSLELLLLQIGRRWLSMDIIYTHSKCACTHTCIIYIYTRIYIYIYIPAVTLLSNQPVTNR